MKNIKKPLLALILALLLVACSDASESKVNSNTANANVVSADAANLATQNSSNITVSVDGKTTTIAAVELYGEILVPLCDVAQGISGTEKQFDVQIDNSERAVKLLSNQEYTRTGKEFTPFEENNQLSSYPLSVYLDDRRIDFSIYTLDQTHYVSLTELAGLFDLHISGLYPEFMINTKEKHGENIAYDQIAHWAVFDENPDKPVDIFFVYPTAWVSPDPVNQKVVAIDDPGMLAGAQNFIYRTIGVFESGNVYAPYYRQFDAGVIFSLKEEERNILVRDIVRDVTAAFDYYIQNVNNDRPFILAGHSQGSLMLTYLLNDYMKEHPEVQERMIAAYAVGISVTESYMENNPKLKFAENATDTGVIISWNTQADSEDVPDLVNPLLEPGVLAINPINWKRDGTYAAVSENLGSSKMNPDGSYSKVMGLADARVDEELGALICKSIDPEENHPWDLFPLGCYHPNDYDLYYYSIQQNVNDRIDAFLNK